MLFASPACIEDFDQFVRDVDAPLIVPTVLEPLLELLAGVLIEHIDVQFPLLRQSGEREIAASQKSSRRIVGVYAVNEVQLRVQAIPQEQLDDELLGFELRTEPPKPCFVRIVRCAKHQL